VVRSILTDQEHQPPRRAGKRRLQLAALAALIALPAVWLALRATSVSFFRDLCEDHARYVNAEAEVRSSEPQVIEEWFHNRTRFAIRVPVSMFQFSEDGVSLRALDRAIIDGAPVWQGSFQGYNLAAFTQRGMVYALVSDLRGSELLKLASEAHVQSRGY
jgi:hypothetical protein